MEAYPVGVDTLAEPIAFALLATFGIEILVDGPVDIAEMQIHMYVAREVTREASFAELLCTQVCPGCPSGIQQPRRSRWISVEGCVRSVIGR